MTRRNPTKLTHVDANGTLRMVSVTDKPATARSASAAATLVCTRATRDAIWAGTGKKGDAIGAARIAGIMAAKRTGELIPLCHPLALSDVDVQFRKVASGIAIAVTCETVGPTGVEMEAMTACAVAGLTLYDMAKSVERGMTLTQLQLTHKRGGASGLWTRANALKMPARASATPSAKPRRARS